jgi:hypothetical protein
MRFLCRLGVHFWRPDIEWASRMCPRCDHREILIYTADTGAVWERVT